MFDNAAMRTDEIIFKNRSKSNKFRMVTMLIKTISKARIRVLIRDRDALMGIGIGTGDNRASDAATMAINSPLLERSIEGAKGIIINITGNEDLGLFEINEASQIITEAADPDANIIWGTSVDPDLDNDTVKITVIATGFGDKKKSPTPAGGNRFSNAVRPATGIAVPEFLRK